ncbi:helix-turn-helix domain-containing protein [Psychrobium sp. nBUS_13]|uniref:helix-turn-helix domain-containing protein n=1 Tax=Psychrobium sp. nBUS_13 TaxID=3395319 RepID=UPI003EBA3463
MESVLAIIHDVLSATFTTDALAKLACLSATQFKVVFKQSLEMTVQQYIRQYRMQNAKALITHTDTPIAIVAQQVGYQDSSAFSRQFKSFFGHSPTQ